MTLQRAVSSTLALGAGFLSLMVFIGATASHHTPAAPPAVSAAPLYKNAAAPIPGRVEDLLKRMTLQEKVAQIGTIWNNKDSILDRRRRTFRSGEGDCASVARRHRPDRAAIRSRRHQAHRYRPQQFPAKATAALGSTPSSIGRSRRRAWAIPCSSFHEEWPWHVARWWWMALASRRPLHWPVPGIPIWSAASTRSPAANSPPEASTRFWSPGGRSWRAIRAEAVSRRPSAKIRLSRRWKWVLPRSRACRATRCRWPCPVESVRDAEHT